MYLTYDEYKALYGEVEETVFNRCLFTAEKAVEDATITADGVNKLVKAFPTEDRAIECVKRCVADCINTLITINAVKNSIAENNGRVVSSLHAGNESITYASTGFEASAMDATAQAITLRRVIESDLHGVIDANGVKLLYRGVYPYIVN